ncbi:hypothetical protein DMC30DRAFT_684 [Rhodotorula diobovata]|uniref:Uncharacterized protein n=1 Tax=Rhodotorula diobovata TaxID=5288 RepID=A0A5C5G694_9BASI|nr:hypothetical protein DMC30DRAFT_684 [Rhodotorula diobovata]
MGNTVSSVGDAVVGAAMWATTPSAAASTGRRRRRSDAPLEYDDVLEVLDVLSQRLPTELALHVIEAAEFWPSVAQSWTGDLTVSAGPQGRRTARTCVVTPPLPSVEGAPEQLVRRVSVWTDSRDQGYSSFPQHHGTRDASSSWFELVLLRPSPPPPPSDPSSSLPPEFLIAHDPAPAPATATSHESYPLDTSPSGAALSPVLSVRLHSNLHSTPTFVPFTTVLSLSRPRSPAPGAAGSIVDPPTPACCTADEATRLLEAARAGDRFAVRACAQYPMWVNRVRGCAVKVEVAVL